MKRLPIITALAVTLLVPSIVSGQDLHAYALIASNEKDAWFIDLKSVSQNNSTMSFWSLQVEDPTTGKASYAVIQYAIDCQGQRITALYGAEYAVDGTPNTSGNFQDTGAPVIPGSVGEILQNYVCKGIDPYPKTGTIDNIVSAINAGHELIAAAKKSSHVTVHEHPKRTPSTGYGDNKI